MKKSIPLFAKCTPVRAFGEWVDNNLKQKCFICGKLKTVAPIPKRYFKKDLFKKSDSAV